MVFERLKYRLRDLRKLRRQRETLLLTEQVHRLFPLRSLPPDGSEWTTPPTADPSSLSGLMDNSLKPSGETPAESTAETASGSPTPIGP